MREEFLEDYQNPHADPLTQQRVDFDFEEIYQHLDGSNADLGSDTEKMGQALRSLFEWITEGELNPQADEAAGHRAIAFTRAHFPGLLCQYAKNAVELAAILGVDRNTIQRWRKLEGCPEPRPDGRYHIASWKAYKEAFTNPLLEGFKAGLGPVPERKGPTT